MKFILIVIYLFNLCTANIHSWGSKEQYSTYRIYERILIDDEKNDEVPKNYTIIHKYFASYYEINVNVESNGYIDQSNGQGIPLPYDLGSQTIQIFDATVHINNAKNVKATLSIYGLGFSSISMGGFFKKQQATKSLTYIYVKNASPKPTLKSFAQNSIGHRRQGDQLIYFESRNVTNVRRFPSRSFEYSGSESNEYITYVGFSFNSPTAMVMDFNAVAYDMNTNHFLANMSVYGIKSADRPYNFLGVI